MSSSRFDFMDYLKQISLIDPNLVQNYYDNVALEKEIIEKNMVNEKLMQVHKKNFDKIEQVDIDSIKINSDLVKKIPEKTSRKLIAIAYKEADGFIYIAMRNPTNLDDVERIRDILQAPLKTAFAKESSLKRIINLSFRANKRIVSLSRDAIKSYTDSGKGEVIDFSSKSKRSSALELLHVLFQDAKNVGASDIHIETNNKCLRIRLRVDGVMEEQVLDNVAELGPPLIRIIKIRSSMDISVENFPQDGRIEFILDSGDQLSGRVSIIPNVEGVSCVIRLFQDVSAIPPLQSVITDPQLSEAIDKFSGQIQGMMLITGPTGSGKTTTLYSLLQRLNTHTKKIITIEDPVELKLPRINQIEINASGKLDFGDALKACLRQDPDIVLVGEIRDENTANIALRAAITGHLVLSTLHTNSTLATVTRLLNLNIAPTLLADGLNLVASQRLLPKICENCKEIQKIEEQDLKYNIKIHCPDIMELDLYVGRGCNLCNYSGYRGRVPIIEFLHLGEDLSGLLEKGDITSFKEIANDRLKGAFLINLAVNQLRNGIITLPHVYSLLT